jgi:Sad1 / UNC-like C-terminal
MLGLFVVLAVAYIATENDGSPFTDLDASSLMDLSELSRRFHQMSDKLRHQIEILQNYEHDKTGRVDLALATNGARIAGVSSDTEFLYSCNFFWKLLGCPNRKNGPEEMILPSMKPGECFKFKGKKATVFIRLISKAILDAVTVEHITKKIGQVSSAPRIFAVSVNVPSSHCRRQWKRQHVLSYHEEEEGESGRRIIDFPQGLLFAFLKKFNQRFFLFARE